MQSFTSTSYCLLEPFVKVVAGSYKFGISWASTCSHQGRLMVVPFGESLRAQAANLASVFLFLLYQKNNRHL